MDKLTSLEAQEIIEIYEFFYIDPEFSDAIFGFRFFIIIEVVV
uniref:Uncharacterized protein n=1 Tax=Tetranychus urticae TaxID=32264 RepID=T1JVJ9_TETUR